MNFLARFFGSKATDPDSLDALRAKVRDLDDKIHDLERSQKNIALEWEETYDKVTHLMARITKRQKANGQGQEAPTEENTAPLSSGPSVHVGSSLGTHSRLQEMRRRMNGVLPR